MHQWKVCREWGRKKRGSIKHLLSFFYFFKLMHIMVHPLNIFTLDKKTLLRWLPATDRCQNRTGDGLAADISDALLRVCDDSASDDAVTRDSVFCFQLSQVGGGWGGAKWSIMQGRDTRHMQHYIQCADIWSGHFISFHYHHQSSEPVIIVGANRKLFTGCRYPRCLSVS